MTDSITAWATLVLAIVAVGGLGVGIWQALLTRKAVASALADVAESRRARIDASSPRIVVTETSPPLYPAGLEQTGVTGNRWQLQAEARFNLPGQAEQRILLTAYVRLKNEGTVSAFLTLPPGAMHVSETGERPSNEGTEVLRWSAGERLVHRLAPGDEQWFLLEGGHTVTEWTELYRRFDGDITSCKPGGELVAGKRFEVEIRDQAGRAFLDTLTIDLLFLPLLPVHGNASQWQPLTFLIDPFKEPRTRVSRFQRKYD